MNLGPKSFCGLIEELYVSFCFPNLKVEENKVKDKGRPSIYTLVPTPRKQQVEKKFNKAPVTRRVFPTTSTLANGGTSVVVKSAIKSQKTNDISANLKKELSRKSPSTSAAKAATVKIAKTLEKSKSKTTATQQSVKKDLRPRALKMPPPPPPRKPFDTKAPVGAIAKVKALTKRNIENSKAKRKSPVKNARLTQNFKAKKPLNSKKGNLTALKINGKQIVNIIKSNELNENMVIQTPRDFATLNPFSEFVTSTKIKETGENLKIDHVSPIEASQKKLHANSSAKRNILAKACDENTSRVSKEEHPQNIKRFNFIRYSESNNLADDVGINNGGDKRCTEADANDKTVVEALDFVINTPTKCGPQERPANYLSPFVSVTRGKVSLKKEKEKRNSVYLQNTESHCLHSELFEQDCPSYSVEVKRTLEAVRYFRKQLQDEIDRLHELCDIWEEYKKDNLEKIQNANGEDMINVAIGQTRLLTSKKFMQFKGLIDRCEAGATGEGKVDYDGSEDTKPITSVDLEGFWSMLGLQVDNLDKRFENLKRWKANEWLDPEEQAKPNRKNMLTKVKKPKAAPAAKSRPNSALQQMLRKMQAELRKNKNNNEETNEIVVLTSSKQKLRRSATSNNSTPRNSIDHSVPHRLSVIVRDRKYYSPVKTVISFSSPNRRASLLLKTSNDSPKLVRSIQKVNKDLDNLEASLGLRRSVLINENSRHKSVNANSTILTVKRSDGVKNVDKENAIEISTPKCLSPQSPKNSPVVTGRKSILKTPGTAKSRLRNVIFNEKLRVKKFNFLINDNVENEEDANNTVEEDLAKCEGRLKKLTIELKG